MIVGKEFKKIGPKLIETALDRIYRIENLIVEGVETGRSELSFTCSQAEIKYMYNTKVNGCEENMGLNEENKDKITNNSIYEIYAYDYEIIEPIRTISFKWYIIFEDNYKDYKEKLKEYGFK